MQSASVSSLVHTDTKEDFVAFVTLRLRATVFAPGGGFRANVANWRGPITLPVRARVGDTGVNLPPPLITEMDAEAEVDPPALEAVSVTVKVPELAYVCAGLWVVSVVPSPKFHDQLVGLPVDVSVNCTVNGVRPSVESAVNDAVGAAGPLGGGGVGGAVTLIVLDAGAPGPAELLAVNVAV
jgi:hypothetical protein